MKRISFFVAALLVAALSFSLPACGKQEGKVIYASQFPQYSFARSIAGDNFTVKMLLPPGADSHTFEPTIRDTAGLSDAELFLYSSSSADSWSANVLNAIKGKKVTAVDLSEGISLIEEEHEHEEGEHREDAHYWLDLANASKMVDSAAAAIASKDAANSAVYLERAEILKAQLNMLDSQIEGFSESAAGKTLFFGGRFAYAYFLQRYGFAYETAYESCSAEVEPSPARIATVISKAKEAGAKYIFREEYTAGGTASAIAGGAGAETLVFHTCHNLSKADLSRGLTFFDIMAANFENVKKALQE